MSLKRKISFIVLLFCAVLMVFVGATSVSKYIFEHKDRIEGSYADIYMTHNGNGQTAIMESDGNGGYLGYISLTVSNDEIADGVQLVSSRKLTYSIRTPSADEINEEQLTDAWGETFPLTEKAISSSAKYSVSFADGVAEEQELGADVTEGDPVRSSRTYIVEVRRDGSAFTDDIEIFDVIIEIKSPYVAYRIFRVNASTSLVSINAETAEHFGFESVFINLKTATTYAFMPEGETYTFLHPAKVELTWNAAVSFDKERFKESVSGSLVPVSQPYRIGYELTEGGAEESLVLYLPQGANLNLYFYVPQGYVIKAAAWFSPDGTENNQYRYDEIAGVRADGVVQSRETAGG